MYIFYGHRVLSDEQSRGVVGPDRNNVISVSELQRLLDKLESYKCLSLGNLNEKASPFLNNCYALTFDDGFKDNLSVLLPILKERGLHATYFVTTRFLEGELPFEYDLWRSVFKQEDGEREYQASRLSAKKKSYKHRKRMLNQFYSHFQDNKHDGSLMLSENELVELSGETSISIGSHSHSHLVMSRQLPWITFGELCLSKYKLEEITSQPINLFAYPYGARSLWTDWLAKMAGYAKIFSTEEKVVNDEQFCMPRISLCRASEFLN